MFNTTSKYFSFFKKAPPASWVAHITTCKKTRGFLTCYSCSYYSSMFLYRISLEPRSRLIMCNFPLDGQLMVPVTATSDINWIGPSLSLKLLLSVQSHRYKKSLAVKRTYITIHFYGNISIKLFFWIFVNLLKSILPKF